MIGITWLALIFLFADWTGACELFDNLHTYHLDVNSIELRGLRKYNMNLQSMKAYLCMYFVVKITSKVLRVWFSTEMGLLLFQYCTSNISEYHIWNNRK